MALPLARRGFWREDFTFSSGHHLQTRAEPGIEDFLLAFAKLTAQSLNSECVWGEGESGCVSIRDPLAVKHGRNSSMCLDIKRRRKLQLVGGP